MWPLGRTIGATTVHRAPKRMADGTRTWRLAWMTDKCRRRMNRREGYITTEISQRRGGPEKGRGRPRERKEALVWPRGDDASPSSGKWSLLLGTLGRSIQCVFHPQNKSSLHQSPTFRPILYKFIVIGSVRKAWPYIFLFILNLKGKKRKTPIKKLLL